MAKIRLDLGEDSDEKEEERVNGEEEGAEKLKINEAYANRYDRWRRLEEMQKLKDKYGNNLEKEDAESSDSSDDVEQADWTAEHERGFFRTLAALKTNDPEIYKADQKFFAAESLSSPKASTSKKEKNGTVEGVKSNKPMFLKDYERKLILERGGDISSEDDESGVEQREHEPGYYEKQEQLKRELKAALLSDKEASDGDDSDLLLKKREISEADLKREEEEYIKWLNGRSNVEIADAKQLKGLREMWSSTNLDEDEKFLRDYLLNKEYEPNETDAIPTYDEITHIDEDEEEMDREKEFERKFNFRFEEPDQEFIRQYPRTIKESLRKKDDARKERRDAYKARKDREKEEKKEKIRELKRMKRTEIEEKLERLKKLAGDEELAVRIEDLEEDFDPAEYDRRMQELFNQQYYEKEVDEDAEKPVFSGVSDESSDESDYDNFTTANTAPEKLEAGEGASDKSDNESDKNDKGGDNDDGDASDKNDKGGDNDDGDARSHREKKVSARRKKRNSRFADAVSREKPLFDPNSKTFEEYFNEYYALDYEDIIGDNLITRFKYRSVPANSFGLTSDEILNADDRQLNAWASLKKVTAYRSEAEERYDQQAYEKKAGDVLKKQRIFSMDYGGKKSKKLQKLDESTKLKDERSTNDGNSMKKKQKQRKKRNKASKNSVDKNEAEKSVEDGIGENKAEFEAGDTAERVAKMNDSATGVVADHSSDKNGDKGADKVDKNGDSTDKKELSVETKKKSRVHRKRKHAAANGFNDNNNRNSTASERWHGGGKRRIGGLDVDDERLRAYGVNPKKFKNRIFHKNKRGALGGANSSS